ncbi:uncharacterized protein IUM83_02264 [Phytophthora cinnamomi]|uniref:uncharacterized protein n=1 Tax=Phytophthora cinnamomi TaxID=4785 RepID=UPI00355964D3|nr:hypothetical protein IUM83_02264 [Phytophthora cinnamomi]
MTFDVASNHGFGVEDVIIADVKGYTTITESMLAAHSPTLASDTEETWAPFVSRLLPTATRDSWFRALRVGRDGERFASVLYEVDMLSALVARLGDVEEAPGWIARLA